MIGLRLSDPLSPRKFKIPLNIPMRFRGERVEFPVIAVLGFIGIFSILMFTLRTHALGRIFGPSWLVLPKARCSSSGRPVSRPRT